MELTHRKMLDTGHKAGLMPGVTTTLQTGHTRGNGRVRATFNVTYCVTLRRG
eukprot:COSAG02_NODE_4045_length_5865_cov_5.416233_3_plen_52_part_00